MFSCTGPLKGFAAPLLLPAQLLQPFTKKREAEVRSQALFNSLAMGLQAGGRPGAAEGDAPHDPAPPVRLPAALPSPEQLQSSIGRLDAETAGQVAGRLQQLQPGISAFGGRFANSLLKQVHPFCTYPCPLFPHGVAYTLPPGLP